MIGRNRRALVALALFFSCATPVPGWAENNCAGGGKPRPDEGGIGGTGLAPVAPEEDDSGIGGTGISAHGDTGIIGTITGFASICVGGVEIHYDAQSAVEIDGQPATVSDLVVGQVVEVVASGTGAEVSARQIAVRHLVAGPITGLDAERSTLDVMGQAVQLPDTQRYEIGEYVRISGLRRADGAIVASLVTSGGDTVHISGPVAEVAPGWLSVGGTRISVTADARVAIGDDVRVSGRWDGAQLVSAAIETCPRLPFDGRVSRVEIEGFASAVTGDQLRVGAFVFEVPPSKAMPPIASESRVRIHAMIHERRAIVQDVGILDARPPRPEAKEGGPESGKILDTIAPAGKDPRNDALDRSGQPPPRERRDAVPLRPFEGQSGVAVPDAARPERPEHPEPPGRPEGAAPPERPPHIERPQLPDRVELPERPPRPERPDVPRRP